MALRSIVSVSEVFHTDDEAMYQLYPSTYLFYNHFVVGSQSAQEMDIIFAKRLLTVDLCADDRLSNHWSPTRLSDRAHQR